RRRARQRLAHALPGPLDAAAVVLVRVPARVARRVGGDDEVALHLRLAREAQAGPRVVPLEPARLALGGRREPGRVVHAHEARAAEALAVAREQAAEHRVRVDAVVQADAAQVGARGDVDADVLVAEEHAVDHGRATLPGAPRWINGGAREAQPA